MWAGMGNQRLSSLSMQSTDHQNGISEGSMQAVYSSEKYLSLFDLETGELISERVKNYRVKTIKAGDLLECEVYPIWNCRNEVRRAKEALSRETQQVLNKTNSRKLFKRLLHNNFGEDDLYVTLTHENNLSMAECKKAVTNYLRRVAYYRKKHGLEDLKYMVVFEQNKIGGKAKRIHHHIVMNGFEDANNIKVVEELWRLGRCNTRRLQPDDCDSGGKRFEQLCSYLTKDANSVRRWSRSNNLDHPQVTVADKKLTRRNVEQMADETIRVGREIFQRLYPGYTLCEDVRIKRSEYVAGAYIYVSMRSNYHIEPKKARKKE